MMITEIMMLLIFILIHTIGIVIYNNILINKNQIIDSLHYKNARLVDENFRLENENKRFRFDLKSSQDISEIRKRIYNGGYND